MAYGEVKLEDSAGAAVVYEDLDKVARSVDGKYELTKHPEAAYEIEYEFQPAAAVCDTTVTESISPSSDHEKQQQAYSCNETSHN